MNVHKQNLFLLKQHSESFEIWLASIRTYNTEGKSLIIKLGSAVLLFCVQLNCSHATFGYEYYLRRKAILILSIVYPET